MELSLFCTKPLICSIIKSEIWHSQKVARLNRLAILRSCQQQERNIFSALTTEIYFSCIDTLMYFEMSLYYNGSCSRFQSSNKLFCGLWFGESKPKMNMFMHPFTKEISTLFSEGALFFLYVFFRHSGTISTDWNSLAPRRCPKILGKIYLVQIFACQSGDLPMKLVQIARCQGSPVNLGSGYGFVPSGIKP